MQVLYWYRKVEIIFGTGWLSPGTPLFRGWGMQIRLVRCSAPPLRLVHSHCSLSWMVANSSDLLVFWELPLGLKKEFIWKMRLSSPRRRIQLMTDFLVNSLLTRGIASLFMLQSSPGIRLTEGSCWASSLSGLLPPCFPCSLTCFTWVHSLTKSLAQEFSNQALIVGDTI